MHIVRVIVTSSILALVMPLALVAQDLTVDQVIELHKGGIGEAVLITYIKQSGKKFTLSPPDILKLTQAKVPQSVIQVMMNPTLNVTATPGIPGVPTGATSIPGAGRSSGATTDDRTAAGDPNDPLSPHDSGIYLHFINKLRQPEMALLEPAAYTGQKSGGFLKSAITYGIAKTKQKAIIQGAKASLRTVDHRPVFYFYFEDKSAALGKSGLFGGNIITSPNQFVALKLDAKKSTRETVVMEAGAFGNSSGSQEKSIVTFKSERLRPGLYKVTFEKDLAPGEYCFLAGMGIGGAGAAGAAMPLQIFDFSVPIEY